MKSLLWIGASLSAALAATSFVSSAVSPAPTPAVLPVAVMAPLRPVVAAAQEQWSWPEKAENLQKLPADFDGNRLSSVMRGFSNALGVRCNHCHVGADGAPLAEIDFVSDDNPMKEVARVMLDLLGDVGKRLDEFEPSGSQPVNMWCHTCHRGRPRPMTIDEEVREALSAHGLDATMEHLQRLRRDFYGRGAYDLTEDRINNLGYGYLQSGETATAVRLFEFNVEHYPESSNVHDSLGEGYMVAGRDKEAIKSYQKSLELDRGNDNAKAMIRELNGR